MLLLIVSVVLVGFVGAGLAGITITVFLHRGLTHGAITLPGPVYSFGRWMTWSTTFMRHWEWRRVHRKHHLYVDTWIDDVRHDPHSPIVISQREGINGFRRVAWHMAGIFHAEARLPDVVDGTYELPTDRPLDRLDMTLFNRPVLGAVTAGVVYAVGLAVLVPLILGRHRSAGFEALCLLGGVVALAVHIGLVLRFGGAINSDCHKGKESTPGAGFALNVGRLSFLIFGEGEHLTHHLHPQLAQISRRWDLGWRVIQVLRALRLTSVAAERSQVLVTVS
ncbi:fatty acid desaturase [Acidiferrimicrobium sp. IK]|uniref:fatty acid desaturase n=1 Tax=Acidiferrimicrobium sp. IK TaxID=2871700 RepID=UPI0021CB6F0C|nr:fatty acid desaturase [Acidiferrimicrobium sp. IK]MCU4182875.1 fatty acid desaturase [Acidiferrimicrobium sp. IK]